VQMSLGQYLKSVHLEIHSAVSYSLIYQTLMLNVLPGVPGDQGISFPRCQEILNQGFCCMDKESCFIDTPSDCSSPNSVQCSKWISLSRLKMFSAHH
jgi:hypothetical protein